MCAKAGLVPRVGPAANWWLPRCGLFRFRAGFRLMRPLQATELYGAKEMGTR